MKKFLSIFLISALFFGALTGCTPDALSGTPTSDSQAATVSGHESSDTPTAEVDFPQSEDDMFTRRDTQEGYDESSAVPIQLKGDSATAGSDGVQIDGSVVTIKEEATYIVSGTLNNGTLVVDAPDTAKLQLVFNGVNITSENSAALYIAEADKVFVTLAAGTGNTLTNGGSFEDSDGSNIDAPLFSKQDLTLNGSGTLTITAPSGHGIVCKDDLVITGGTYVVNAASHGLDANDSVRITNANLTIDTGKDAIHAENKDDGSKGFVYISDGTIKAEAEGDGIDAGAYLQIVNGTMDLLVGGGSKNSTKEHSDSFGGFMGGGHGGRPGPGGRSTESDTESSTSMKGLKAAKDILISDGNITINSADDAIHSNTCVTINGGSFTIASGDDAVHAEETLTITAGNMDISESYEGLEALHVDVQGGNIKLVASDDGLNAAGGTDQSGTTGGRDGMFGGRPGMGGGHGGFGGNSNGSITISGGTLYIEAHGDGMDANGTLEISGGHTTVVGPTQGDTATLDYDKTGTITGGTFIGTGSTMMAQSFSDSTQGVVALNVGNRLAGTEITLKDSQGNTLITRTPELDFAVVILSSPELKKGETYSVTIGAETEEFEAG